MCSYGINQSQLEQHTCVLQAWSEICYTQIWYMRVNACALHEIVGICCLCTHSDLWVFNAGIIDKFKHYTTKHSIRHLNIIILSTACTGAWKLFLSGTAKVNFCLRKMFLPPCQVLSNQNAWVASGVVLSLTVQYRKRMSGIICLCATAVMPIIP